MRDLRAVYARDRLSMSSAHVRCPTKIKCCYYGRTVCFCDLSDGAGKRGGVGGGHLLVQAPQDPDDGRNQHRGQRPEKGLSLRRQHPGGVGGGSLVQKGRAYSFVTGHPPIGRHQGVEGWCTWLTVRRVCESQSRHWGRWGGRASVRLLQLQSKEFLTAFFQILIFPLQFLF